MTKTIKLPLKEGTGRADTDTIYGAHSLSPVLTECRDGRVTDIYANAMCFPPPDG